jgi:hypothetical protein
MPGVSSMSANQLLRWSGKNCGRERATSSVSSSYTARKFVKFLFVAIRFARVENRSEW